MLTQPTAQHLRAFVVLKSQSAWDEVSKYLDGELSKIYERLTYTADEVQVRQLQGRAAAITELKATVQGARASLERLGLQAPI